LHHGIVFNFTVTPAAHITVAGNFQLFYIITKTNAYIALKITINNYFARFVLSASNSASVFTIILFIIPIIGVFVHTITSICLIFLLKYGVLYTSRVLYTSFGV